MEILTQLEKDYLQAFKEKNELVLLVLRGLKTAITNAEIAKNRQALTGDELIKLLKTEVKRRKEAAEMYQTGNRPDLAEKETKEIEVIVKYLPAELSEEDVKQKISQVIAQVGATSPADTGKVMGLVMKELGSMADGNVVSRLVKAELFQ
ncbi:MAG: GatB/YqeY domain-containing protein [Candidatus Buchananbacteria bacterium]